MKRILLSLVLLGSLSFSGIAAEAQRPIPRFNQPGFAVNKKNMYSTYRIRIFATPEQVKDVDDGLIQFRKYSGDDDLLIGMGTGFAISPVHIVSAAHVAVPGAAFFLDVFDADGVYSESLPLVHVKSDQTDPNKDLALFRTLKAVPSFINLRYGTADVGDWCYTVGARYGDVPYCVGWGIVATKSHEAYPGLWMATIMAAPGNSGGPVFNSKHQFLGVLVRGTPGLILFVKAESVKAFLDGSL